MTSTTTAPAAADRLKFGLLVNPVSGLGGPAALKGSDGAQVQDEARARGVEPRANARLADMLAAFSSRRSVDWCCAGGAMGEQALRNAGVDAEVIYTPPEPSTAEDTRQAARRLLEAGVDVIVFGGGDGTARDLLQAIGEEVPVLGVPTGVKMHSGVFATTPADAGALLDALVQGGLVAARRADVRDIDEAALRRGEIGNRFFGELRVPDLGGYLQHTKVAGRESEELAVVEIIADLTERFADTSRTLVIGPGSTLAEFKLALGIEPTLLGFDVVRAGQLAVTDADRACLDALAADNPVVFLSFNRGQGFLVGRGNQQLSPQLLGSLRRDDLIVVGTRSKLASLDGRPLLIDSGDVAVDSQWSGLIEITAGYEDRLFHRLSATLDPSESR